MLSTSKMKHEAHLYRHENFLLMSFLPPVAILETSTVRLLMHSFYQRVNCTTVETS